MSFWDVLTPLSKKIYIGLWIVFLGIVAVLSLIAAGVIR